jgi:GntR family transcriptional regulator
LLELPEDRIDRKSSVPYYAQLKDLLAAEIAAGRWAAGQRLPSEPYIGEHFDVSRTTVRQALAELERDMLVQREKGRGTFVAPGMRDSWLLQSTASFHEELTRAGHVVRSQVLRLEVAPLPDWACERLRLRSGSRGVVLERIRSVDGRVVMYVRNYLQARYATAIRQADLVHDSLYTTLRQAHRLSVVGGRRRLDAVAADEDMARALEVAEGTPLLEVHSTSLDEHLRPFECYVAWQRPDRLKITVSVVSHDAALEAGFDPANREVVDP